LFAKEGPSLTEYSLNLLAIIDLYVVVLLSMIKVSLKGESCEFRTSFIVFHAYLILHLNNSSRSLGLSNDFSIFLTIYNDSLLYCVTCGQRLPLVIIDFILL